MWCHSAFSWKKYSVLWNMPVLNYHKTFRSLLSCFCLYPVLSEICSGPLSGEYWHPQLKTLGVETKFCLACNLFVHYILLGSFLGSFWFFDDFKYLFSTELLVLQGYYLTVLKTSAWLYCEALKYGWLFNNEIIEFEISYLAEFKKK